MPTITTGRQGSLTALAIECATLSEALAVLETIARHTTRAAFHDGTLIRISCKAREAAQIQASVEQMPAAPAAPAAATTAPEQAWRYRELVSVQFGRAAATREINGQTLRFTGYGTEFRGREIDGPLWGEAVRYAYYA